MPNTRLKLISKGSLVAILVAVFLTFGISKLINGNVDGPQKQVRDPLPVGVLPFNRTDSYIRQSSYIGTVRARRDSALAFEVSGTLETLPAREGMPITEGQILASLNTDQRRAQLRAAEAELAKVTTNLELAILKRERLADLLDRGLTSRQTFDDAKLGAQALQQNQRAIRARLDSAALNIEKSALKAPFAGVVAQRYVDEGTVVTPGTPILRLLAQSSFEAHVGVPVRVGNTLKVGSEYALTVGGRRLEATLQNIRSDVDASTLTVGAIFLLPENLLVRTGETITLDLTSAVYESGGWVPLSSLTAGNRGLWDVFVVKAVPDGHVAAREAVEIIYSENDQVFVAGTLADDAVIIASGLHRLSPGASITPLEN
ncbi:MAG: efflux RND transporter periplasmic adaptor subunit [Luminiphilus sp.]|nr:efflux RND transporter periplasmic adaptor subunit [Luminiphilus sp.]